MPLDGAQREHRVEREDGRGDVRSGVRVGQRPAQGAAVADLDVTDVVDDLGQQRRALGDERRLEHRSVGHRGADDDTPVGALADALELRQPADVDQGADLGEPQLEQGQQAHAAADDLRVRVAPGQDAQGLLDRRRARVVELGGDHAGFTSAPAMARHTVWDVKGMSRWRTPSGASASMTALTAAGVLAMAPASPTPLTPSGLTGDGVTVSSSSKPGSQEARGRA